MNAKVHIVDSDEPLTQSCFTRCRLFIVGQKIAFMWDEQAMGEQVSFPINACRKCLRAPEVSLRYVYGVREL